jgi:hypothetical protein
MDVLMSQFVCPTHLLGEIVEFAAPTVVILRAILSKTI